MFGRMGRRLVPMLASPARAIMRLGPLALALMLVPAAAKAQDNSAQNQPVVNPQPDINGVDVASAQYSVASALGFSAPGAEHLRVRSVFNGRRFTTNLETYLTDDTLTEPDSGNPNSRQIKVHVEGVDRIFVCATIGLCQQIAKVDGARLTRTADKSYSFQGRDGTLVSFFPMYVEPIPFCMGGSAGCNGANYGGFAYASSITYANGEKLTRVTLTIGTAVGLDLSNRLDNRPRINVDTNVLINILDRPGSTSAENAMVALRGRVATISPYAMLECGEGSAKQGISRATAMACLNAFLATEKAEITAPGSLFTIVRLMTVNGLTYNDAAIVAAGSDHGIRTPTSDIRTLARKVPALTETYKP